MLRFLADINRHDFINIAIREELQRVLNEESGAMYNGGGLFIKVGEDSISINLGVEDADPDILSLAAQIYLKHKTPNHSFWELAKKLAAPRPIAVTMNRVEYRSHDFEVMATTHAEAERLVLEEENPNYDWHDSPITSADEDLQGTTG
jgi:hypothetical protein